ncbi:Stage II sporulation protein E (SpoIIE) [Caloramator fervidus]|uniref:Stage II sporulation protein E (SpoIIE) n=1 Tax=Caloramator fervidus TaxID=29344 RepID=A0A1H5RR16_9CLOT|nr:SpoIIE family protein phosphatase [Caloramator fervidus]SEF39941.1 Stage II sporulation protein E (SpoIIE) [Caloramator fervidus]
MKQESRDFSRGRFNKEVYLDRYLILMADVLGHGIKAYEVAKNIKSFFLSYEYKNLEDFYIKLDTSIKGTRGCALFLAILSEFELEYINVGNIRGWLINKNNIKKLMSSPGVVGRHQGYYKIYKESAIMHDAFFSFMLGWNFLKIFSKCFNL